MEVYFQQIQEDRSVLHQLQGLHRDDHRHHYPHDHLKQAKHAKFHNFKANMN